LLNKLIFCFCIATITALNAILLIVACTNGQILGHSTNFNFLVNFMYFSLISSSLILSYRSWRHQQKIWSLLFTTNIMLVLIPTLLSMKGSLKVSPTFMIFLDLYWLNQYLVFMATKPIPLKKQKASLT
jgi:hypothetical protein